MRRPTYILFFCSLLATALSPLGQAQILLFNPSTGDSAVSAADLDGQSFDMASHTTTRLVAVFGFSSGTTQLSRYNWTNGASGLLSGSTDQPARRELQRQHGQR